MQLERFLQFDKNLMLLSTFASGLPHNLCPTESWSSVTATSHDLGDYFSAANQTDGHSAEDDQVCNKLNGAFIV